MRENISITLLIVAVVLAVAGLISIIALGITTVVGFTGASIPFGFAFLIASVLLIAFAMVTEGDVEVTQ